MANLWSSLAACCQKLPSCLAAALGFAASSSVPSLPQLPHTQLLLLTSCCGWSKASSNAASGKVDPRAPISHCCHSPVGCILAPVHLPYKYFRCYTFPLPRTTPFRETKGIRGAVCIFPVHMCPGFWHDGGPNDAIPPPKAHLL